MIFSPIENNRTAYEVERQIERLVLEGVLCSGDRLPGERAMADAFGVSRPILREALAKLENRDLLIAKPGGGTFVADVIGTVFAPPVIELIGRHPRAKSDYMEYRREMEGMAAAMATRRATQADHDWLGRIIEDMKTAHAKGDAEQEAALDVEFHSAIGEAAHNIVLLHTLRSCYRLLSDDVFTNRMAVYENENLRNGLLEQHCAIYEAVISGNSDAAEQAASDHIRFIEQATAEAERHEGRSAISALRLAQRASERPVRKGSAKTGASVKVTANANRGTRTKNKTSASTTGRDSMKNTTSKTANNIA